MRRKLQSDWMLDLNETTPGRPDDIGGAPKAFRFFDNREKYLLFVTTCSEKWAVADRVGHELRHLKPSPPALRVFDAGMGDGSVLTRVLREMHCRFPTIPFQVVAKEISLEDVRLSLDKIADRMLEHPATVFVATNLYYSEAPALRPRDPAKLKDFNWLELPLKGRTSHEFDEQLREVQSKLADIWQTRTSPKTGNPLYAKPSALVIYREDQRFVLDQVIPRPDPVRFEDITPAYDLIIASQPYRARQPAEFKVDKVLGPLAKSLAPNGRMIVIQSAGRDPGMEIVHGLWPDERPFATPAHMLVTTMRDMLAQSDPDLKYDEQGETGSLFRFHLHALPSELGESIGTSTLLAAWNAAVYVAQIEDRRLTEAMTDSKYLDVTADVLRRNGGLWFLDEAFVVYRPG
ncbi:hypothetical protein [Hwanghaeella sp.]|uniref:hypothetical protein n=1 Tax=Hwanghaeella sp. TaxID=2605943 RepID=UPI003CCC01D3